MERSIALSQPPTFELPIPIPMPDVSKEIQVSGLRCFPEHLWREAILHYLNGVWGNKQHVMYRPKIAFGHQVLRLDIPRAEYFAYFNDEGSPEEPPSLLEENVLAIACYQVEVEQGLVRFVKNEDIRMLVINLRNHGKFYLWKKERRGQYGVAASRVPASMHEACELG